MVKLCMGFPSMMQAFTLQAANTLEITCAREEQQHIENQQRREDYDRQTVQLKEAHDEIRDLQQRMLLLMREDHKTTKASRQDSLQTADASTNPSSLNTRLTFSTIE